MDKQEPTASSRGADDADTATIGSIVSALYDCISGGPGEIRDWERFRNLFHEDARLIPSALEPDGKLRAQAYTPDGYIRRTEEFFLENGFFEKETARRVLAFGGIAHVFSTYEGRRKESDETPFLRGINSIQLLNEGDRWRIVTVFWQPESEGVRLPQEFLPREIRNL